MRVADAWSTDGVPKVVFTDYYRISEIVRLSDCFASLAMTCNGLFMSLREAQRRSTLYPGSSQNLRHAVRVRGTSPAMARFLRSSGQALRLCLRMTRLPARAEFSGFVSDDAVGHEAGRLNQGVFGFARRQALQCLGRFRHVALGLPVCVPQTAVPHEHFCELLARRVP